MVYQRIKDLPEAIKDRLPLHAQHIYLSAFNNATEEYNYKNSESSVEETSHRVAWAAVKRKYSKASNNKWKRKEG